MANKPCPGCDTPIEEGLLCCDPCWARIPTRVPGFTQPWRSSRIKSRPLRDWGRFEQATEAALAWLVAHHRPERRVL